MVQKHCDYIITWLLKIMHHTDSIMVYLGDADYTSLIKLLGIQILVTLIQKKLKSLQNLTIVNTSADLIETYIMRSVIIISF